MKCLELFTVAGGLAMGIGSAGFQHAGVVEFDHDSCETMRFNGGADGPLSNWPIRECDVREIEDFGAAYPGVDLVAGGPPCQPFSLGGKARGSADPRDMFPEAVRAVRQTHPAAFIFENVKGLLWRSFASYLEYVYLQMTYPTVTRKNNESADDHKERLERVHTQGRGPSLRYKVVFGLVNAANYGVPQTIMEKGYGSALALPIWVPAPRFYRFQSVQ